MASSSTATEKTASRSATGKTSRGRSKANAKPKAIEVAEVPDTSANPSVEAIKSLGKRELIDRVVATSGVKKKAAKPVVEALLLELGEALARGETLNLQPFGKASVKRRKDLENAEIIELRLRRSKQAVKAAAEEAEDNTSETPAPLAEAAE